MSPKFPRCFGPIPIPFRHPLALLGGVLLCIAPMPMPAQTVSFVGALTTLPFTGVPYAAGVAVDTAGNVYLYDTGNRRVLKLLRTSTGFGPQTTVPAGHHLLPVDRYTAGVAVDGAGDVFITDRANPIVPDYGEVIEIPWNGTSYGAPLAYSVYAQGADYFIKAQPTGIALDSEGNIFTNDEYNDAFLEMARVGSGYGTAIQIGDMFAGGIAVDSAGNAFLADNSPGAGLREVPKTSTGYGAQIALPFTSQPWGVAVDSAGNLFIAAHDLIELPKTSTGYGPQITLLTGIGDFGFLALAADSTGNLFLSENDNGGSVVQLLRNSPDFGNANVCASGQTMPAPCSQTLPLTYNVTASGILGTPKVLTGGAPSLDFTLASGLVHGTTCTGMVTAGSACTVTVTFAPQAAGTRNGTVELVDGSGNVLATTMISGFGIAVAPGPPVAQLSTTVLSFATIPYGSIETLPLTITNIGGETLTIAPSISGLSYSVATSPCEAGLIPGSRCTLQVQFSPASVAYHYETLTLQTNGTVNPTVALHGAASGLRVSGAPLDFGAVPLGSAAVLPLTVTGFLAPGTITVGTASSGPSYSVLTTAQNTCQGGITDGQSCILPVQFAPDFVGEHHGILALTQAPGAKPNTVAMEGVGSAPLPGHGVTFAGAQTTIPASGFNFVWGVAVDGAGNVFISDRGNNRVVEVPRTSTGYGSQITLPFSGLEDPSGIAVDAAGDVFIADYFNYRVLELPRTSTGYGPQAVLADGLNYPSGVALDPDGDVFILNSGNYDTPPPGVLELLKTSTGYGPPTTVPTSLGLPYGIAVDSSANVFIADLFGFAAEVSPAGTGYGQQVTLPFSSLATPYGIAVDGAGNVFVADNGHNRVAELPRLSTYYAPQTILPTSASVGPFGLAVDGAGNVFIAGDNDAIQEVQTHSVDFGEGSVCGSGQTGPPPCSQTLTLNFRVNAGETLGTPKVLTGGVPDLDFTLASGSTCTGAVTQGAICSSRVTFAPLAAGTRSGVVEITDGVGDVIATTPISGFGVAASAVVR